MKTNAVQRSLKILRDNGWTCHIVEKFLPARGSMKFPRRIDAFGIGDILACRPNVYGEQCGYCHGTGRRTSSTGLEHTCDGCAGIGKLLLGKSAIALVQCCPGASHAEHKEKILAIPELATWKAAGGQVFLQSWAKQGPRGEKKKWVMREEVL